MMNPSILLIFPFLAAAALAQDKESADATPSWPNWRGPGHDAVATTGNPPTEWNEESGKNIRWVTPIPGKGSSSPIVWKDRIFVTTAIETEKTGKPVVAPPPTQEGEREGEGRQRGGRRGGNRGRRGGRGRAPAPTKVHEFVVLAYDRNTGKEAWRTPVLKRVPHAGTHNTGSQASNSPITDGTHLFAFFGSRGLHCLDLKGKLLWSEEFGQMKVRNNFGEGASPALHGDTIVVNWDHDLDSFLVALDKKTGKERWRKPRKEASSWTTPLIITVDGKPQVIVAGTKRSISYDLATGDEIWSCSGLTGNVIPTPIYHQGVVYLMSGYRGNALQAIRVAGAKGAVEDGPNLLWKHSQNCPYTPSGLVYGGNVYFLRTNSPILSCLDAKTGEVKFEAERMRGMRTVYSSPVGVADRVYITGRQGTTKVVKAADKYELLATNKVEDTIDATAAVVGDALYLRGWSKLYCIAKTEAKAPKKGD